MISGRGLIAASVLLMADGLMKVTFGRRYLKSLQAILGPFGFVARLFLDWPDSLIRVVGLAKFLAGVAILWPRLNHTPSPLRAATRLIRLTTGQSLENTLDRLTIRYMPPGARILSVGHGSDRHLERLLRLGLPFSTFIALTNEDEKLSFQRRGSNLEGTEFHSLPRTPENLPPGPFDLIYISNDVMKMELVDAARRTLDPDGFLIGVAKGSGGNLFHRFAASAVSFGLPSVDALPAAGKVGEEWHVGGTISVAVFDGR